MSSTDAVIDPAHFRHTLGHYPTGVCAVTAVFDGAPVALIVGSFTSVSLAPPLVAFYPQRSSTTWAKIAQVGRFCVNVFGADQADLCQTMARQRGGALGDVPHTLSAHGLPVLDGVVAKIECDLHAVDDAGDHFCVMGRVLHLDVETAGAPLLYFRGKYGTFSAL